MTNRFVARMIPLAVVAVLSLTAVPASGQALFSRDAPKEPGARSWALERAKLPPFDPPRTPDGKPDLRGRWGGTPGGDDLEEHPYVLIGFNFGHYYRFIPTDWRPHGVGQNVKLWMGNSRGSWDGNTLVVDVTSLNAKNWLDQVGNFFSDNVHVVERFSLAGANIIDYEVTIDDPKVFTRPWKIRLPLRRAGAGDAKDPYANETWENACYEGNRAAEHVRDLGYKWFSGVVPPK